jgi:hypothetical protein
MTSRTGIDSAVALVAANERSVKSAEDVAEVVR